MRDFGAGHALIIGERIADVIAQKQETRKGELRGPIDRPPTRAPQSGPLARENSEIGIAELFFSADSAARRVLLMSLGNAETETPQSVLPVETIRALEAAALGRDRDGFTTLIENALGLSCAQAERIVHDQSGEPLLVAARALAMPSVALQRVLMFIDPAIGESVQRFFDLAGFYERLSADAAHKIVASIRGHEPVRARRPAPRPMYYDDEATRSRRGSPARRIGVAEPQAPARTETGKTQRTM